jgi:hypothetical protein
MSAYDIGLDLTSDGATLSLETSSPSVAEVGSGLCWNLAVPEAVSEKIAGLVS